MDAMGGGDDDMVVGFDCQLGSLESQSGNVGT